MSRLLVLVLPSRPRHGGLERLFNGESSCPQEVGLGDIFERPLADCNDRNIFRSRWEEIVDLLTHGPTEPGSYERSDERIVFYFPFQCRPIWASVQPPNRLPLCMCVKLRK
jgi:hypothetical protein